MYKYRVFLKKIVVANCITPMHLIKYEYCTAEEKASMTFSYMQAIKYCVFTGAVGDLVDF